MYRSAHKRQRTKETSGDRASPNVARRSESKSALDRRDEVGVRLVSRRHRYLEEPPNDGAVGDAEQRPAAMGKEAAWPHVRPAHPGRMSKFSLPHIGHGV